MKMAHIAAHLSVEIVMVVTVYVALDISSLPLSEYWDFGLRVDHKSGTERLTDSTN